MTEKNVNRPAGSYAADGEVLAEKAATWERPMGSDPRDPDSVEGVDVADADMLVKRQDLDTESHVFVAEGERIPRETIAPGQEPVRKAPSEQARKRSTLPKRG